MEPQQLEEADAAAIAYCEKHGLDPATVSVEFRDTGNGMQAVGHMPIPYNPTWPTSTPPPPQSPSIGRTVHYVSYGTPGGEYPSVCRAAIITAVDTYQDGESSDGTPPRTRQPLRPQPRGHVLQQVGSPRRGHQARRHLALARTRVTYPASRSET